MIKNLLLTTLVIIAFSACSDSNKEAKGSASSGMKCGAGKCGTNMFDGKGALAKKKKNILKQMRKDDPRKDCVINAKTTKAVYNCVRSPETDKLTRKCGANMTPTMKCGSGKCGNGMK